MSFCGKKSWTESSREKITHLEETVRELNEIIDLSADGLVSVDSQGILLRMNRAYENIVGVRASDFVGKPAIELKRQGYLPDLVSLHVLKDMKPKNIFVQLRERNVLITGRPVFNSEGEFIRIVANIRDLTELNALKEELKKYYELADRYETELKQLRARELVTDLVSCSPIMEKVVDMAIQASQAEATVLISGETGTGKEIVARIIHRSGQRKENSFISILSQHFFFIDAELNQRSLPCTASITLNRPVLRVPTCQALGTWLAREFVKYIPWQSI